MCRVRAIGVRQVAALLQPGDCASLISVRLALYQVQHAAALTGLEVVPGSPVDMHDKTTLAPPAQLALAAVGAVRLAQQLAGPPSSAMDAQLTSFTCISRRRRIGHRPKPHMPNFSRS